MRPTETEKLAHFLRCWLPDSEVTTEEAVDRATDTIRKLWDENVELREKSDWSSFLEQPKDGDQKQMLNFEPNKASIWLAHNGQGMLHVEFCHHGLKFETHSSGYLHVEMPWDVLEQIQKLDLDSFEHYRGFKTRRSG